MKMGMFAVVLCALTVIGCASYEKHRAVFDRYAREHYVYVGWGNGYPARWTIYRGLNEWRVYEGEYRLGFNHSVAGEYYDVWGTRRTSIGGINFSRENGFWFYSRDLEGVFRFEVEVLLMTADGEESRYEAVKGEDGIVRVRYSRELEENLRRGVVAVMYRRGNNRIIYPMPRRLDEAMELYIKRVGDAG